MELAPIYPASYYNSTNRIAGFIILDYDIQENRVPFRGFSVYPDYSYEIINYGESRIPYDGTGRSRKAGEL